MMRQRTRATASDWRNARITAFTSDLRLRKVKLRQKDEDRQRNTTYIYLRCKIQFRSDSVHNLQFRRRDQQWKTHVRDL